MDADGMLDRALLHDPEVLELVTRYGAPCKVLAPVSHEAQGSGMIR